VEARSQLDAEGLRDVEILASGGLDEQVIADLERSGAPIDAYGVGTKVGVSADAPFLDSVYKIVSYEDRPVAKLSTAKQTSPSPKQVWRLPEGAGDVVTLRDEPGPQGAEPLMTLVMEGGHRTSKDGLREARIRFEQDLGRLPPSLRSLDPPRYRVADSPRLEALSHRTRREIGSREDA
jgi:nicotinate phosphoribosyltransferase